jgi:hypothetical protein
MLKAIQMLKAQRDLDEFADPLTPPHPAGWRVGGSPAARDRSTSPNREAFSTTQPDYFFVSATSFLTDASEGSRPGSI